MRSLSGIQDQLDRLLTTQPASKKAALVLAYLARGDTVAADKVAATLLSEAEDRDFTSRLEDLMWMASLWASAYWQQRARCHALHAALLILVPRQDPRVAEAEGALRAAESQLLAIDRVLQDVCASAGLSADDVRATAGATADPYRPITCATAPDAPEFGADLREVLAMLAK